MLRKMLVAALVVGLVGGVATADWDQATYDARRAAVKAAQAAVKKAKTPETLAAAKMARGNLRRYAREAMCGCQTIEALEAAIPGVKANYRLDIAQAAVVEACYCRVRGYKLTEKAGIVAGGAKLPKASVAAIVEREAGAALKTARFGKAQPRAVWLSAVYLGIYSDEGIIGAFGTGYGMEIYTKARLATHRRILLDRLSSDEARVTALTAVHGVNTKLALALRAFEPMVDAKNLAGKPSRYPLSYVLYVKKVFGEDDKDKVKAACEPVIKALRINANDPKNSEEDRARAAAALKTVDK